MTPDNEKPSFLDRGTLIALAIVLIFWIGWSKYMEKAYPPAPETPTVVVNDTTVAAAPAASPGKTAVTAPTTADEAAAAQPAPTTEQTFDFSNDVWSFKVSSKGMGVREITLKKYETRDDKPIALGENKGVANFATTWAGTEIPVDFTVEQTGADSFVGRAEGNGVRIEKTFKINSANYTIDTSVKVTNLAGPFSSNPAFRGISTRMSDVLTDSGGGSFFAPAYDFLSWFVFHDATKTRQAIHKKEGAEVSQKNVSVAALSAHYFTLAIMDRSPLLPSFQSKTTANADFAAGSLVYEPAGQSESLEAKYVSFAGPKSFDLLASIDPNATGIIDYGMFAVLAKPMLWLLRFLNSIFGNWGWAIIGLTIIVRLIVLPFNAYSYKSMKVMQKLQPEMNRIREKYKDAPPEKKMQMNQEIMTLMRESKANPLGGCLPMLLQLPVFLALYQVLGQSIELYRAPWILWIHDLSMKDPYYVLPVLMAITMFIQQKITPSTMDPQQAKIMLWMPVIFAVFMVALPSGLTLYIFVSTLFGIIQQYFLMRDRTPAQTVKAAKA